MLMLFFILSCYTEEFAHIDGQNLKQVKKELPVALDLCWKKSDGFFSVQKM